MSFSTSGNDEMRGVRSLDWIEAIVGGVAVKRSRSYSRDEEF